MSTDSYDAQIRAALGGQIAPLAADTGRRVLYRCNHCGQVWLMDGPRVRLRLAGEELAALAQELAADIGALPYATCRICAAQGLGEIGIDEYGRGAGYGVSVELVNPTGGHLIGAVIRLDWLQQEKRLGRAPHANVVTNYAQCRAFLAWLERLASPTSYQPITEADSVEIARDNPPGHRAPGTEGWRWYGASWVAPCPPLGGRVYVNLSQAMPPDEVFSLSAMLTIWRELARIVSAGNIAGEIREE